MGEARPRDIELQMLNAPGNWASYLALDGNEESCTAPRRHEHTVLLLGDSSLIEHIALPTHRCQTTKALK